MKPKALDQCRLYAFVDTAYLAGRAPLDIARQLCEGEADVIQLRAKGASTQAVREMAETILPILQAAGVHLVINDHPEVALGLPGTLCHLGQEDFACYGHVKDLLKVLAPDRPKLNLPIGLSTHHPKQAIGAIAAGASYLGVGPVFRTETKPNAQPVTLDYVRWAAAHVSIPWFAIGGINLTNIDSVLEAGARRICVVSAILQAPNVARACQQFRNRLLSAGSNN